jgi:hypothetical protein
MKKRRLFNVVVVALANRIARDLGGIDAWSGVSKGVRERETGLSGRQTRR